MKQDQAQKLRELYQQFNRGQDSERTRFISVVDGTSSRDGELPYAWKTALEMAKAGEKVVLIDLKYGEEKLRSTNEDLAGSIGLWRKGPHGLKFMFAGSTWLNQFCEAEWTDMLKKLQGCADIVLLNMGTSLSTHTIKCHHLSDEIVLV